MVGYFLIKESMKKQESKEMAMAQWTLKSYGLTNRKLARLMKSSEGHVGLVMRGYRKLTKPFAESILSVAKLAMLGGAGGHEDYEFIKEIFNKQLEIK